MRLPLVVGNWKMNGTTTQIMQLIHGILETKPTKSGLLHQAEIAICPPCIYVPLVKDNLLHTTISWGLQNISDNLSGAYTGEISLNMAKDFDCSYVIIGHSERRNLYHETDELIAKKFVATLQAGLIPIICVGETLDERQSGETLNVINRQIMTVLKKMDNVISLKNQYNQTAKFIIAYEPVWAIGTGLSATPEQAQKVHQYIRGLLSTLSVKLEEQTRIIYGGSINIDNAPAIFKQPDIDGGLVGGASLKAKEFNFICSVAGS